MLISSSETLLIEKPTAERIGESEDEKYERALQHYLGGDYLDDSNPQSALQTIPRNEKEARRILQELLSTAQEPYLPAVYILAYFDFYILPYGTFDYAQGDKTCHKLGSQVIKFYENKYGIDFDNLNNDEELQDEANDPPSELPRSVQFTVATIFDFGFRGKDETHKSFRFYKNLSDSGNAIGQFNLALLYLDGLGETEPDHPQGIRLMKKSGLIQNYPPAMRKMGHLYLFGFDIQRINPYTHEIDANAEDVDEDNPPKELNYELIFPELHLAQRTEEGREEELAARGIVEKNTQKAFKLFKISADLGFWPAMNSVGYCYCNGTGTEQDYSMGAKYFKKSTEFGSGQGWCNLAFCTKNGYGMPRNKKKALEYYLKAAELGSQKGLKGFVSMMEDKFEKDNCNSSWDYDEEELA